MNLVKRQWLVYCWLCRFSVSVSWALLIVSAVKF